VASVKTPLLLTLASLAVGYTLGRFHVAGHTFDWLYDVALGDHRPHSFRWVLAESAGCLLLAFGLIVRPKRTWLAIHEAPVAVFAGVVWSLGLIAGTAWLLAKVIV
jgi:hypothetical protein